MDYRLYIYDALTGKLRVAAGRFMTIGRAQSNSFRVEMKARTGGTFAMQGDVCRFFPHGQVKDFSINGMHPGRDVRIHPRTFYLMTVTGGCFLCWFGLEEEIPDFSVYNPGYWYSYDIKTKTWSDAFSLPDLCAGDREPEPDMLVAFEGMQHCAFLAKDLIEVSQFAATLEQFRAPGESNTTELQPEDKNYTCPFCWTKFAPHDLMAIASHPQLKGDPLLGKEAMQRFKPTTYNSAHLPLDAGGAICRGTACPHCHSKLPAFFSELHPRLISIAGISGSGKTYYLTTLINEAVRAFSRDFDASFRDTSPAANAPLNRLRQQLFTAITPQQAYLEPTQTKAPYYHKVFKDGTFYDLPVPYMYGVSLHGTSYSLMFYDNAGADYEPGSREDGPVTTAHLNVASAIFIIIDPTLSPSFQRLLHNEEKRPASQFNNNTSRQSQMIGELEMQLRMRFNQPPPAKLPIPIALIMNKSDEWLKLLGPEPLLPAVHNGRLMPSCIQANSARLRSLLFSVAPQMCSSVEAISHKVCYFGTSALGKPPVKFDLPDSAENAYAPESGDIHPDHVIDPLLWAINIMQPNFLPKNH